MTGERAITRHRAAQADLRSAPDAQAAVAWLGQQALAGIELHSLRAHAVEVLTATLAVDHCGVFELDPTTSSLRLVAAAGWPPGAIGQATMGADPRELAGHTLLRADATVVADAAGERRFAMPALLRQQGVVSAMTTTIGDPARPFGLLAVSSRERRRFTADDAHFLDAVANVIATAAERMAAEHALREQARRFEAAHFDERLRLARALHDGLAQELWLAKLKHGLVVEALEADGEASTALDDLAAAIQRALDLTRDAVMSLREPVTTVGGDGPGREPRSRSTCRVPRCE